MQGEQVDKLAHFLGIPKLAFEHPVRKLLLDCFPLKTGDFRNVVLTGTAGDGKTSLCFDLVFQLTGNRPQGVNGVEQINVETPIGPRRLTLIYDVTGWRKRTDGYISQDDVALLERIARSAFEASEDYFVLAVNDGQMHELFRALPENVPESIRKLERSLIGLHARHECDAGERLRLINLSTVPSERIMELCLSAVLDRAEWACFEEEPDNPLFSSSFSLARNFRTLNAPETRAKLMMLARIADVTGHHLPIRGVLCMLCNALLGHPEAKDRVLRPGPEVNMLAKSESTYRAAFHRNLFGENLTLTSRRKREIYRFLSMLHIGEETTNDLDELFIFGTRDPELRPLYMELVAPDPYQQRNPDFDGVLRRYIRGDITTDDDTRNFLSELSVERRRIFVQASAAQFQKYGLWKMTVFHHAREFLEEVVATIEVGKPPARLNLRKLASGLNRIWTGLLLSEQANEIYLTTGLDLSTSAVSDVFLSQTELDSDPPGLEVVRRNIGNAPEVVLRANGREFHFTLTLQRFEFLCRVADGAMPSSFSRESCADFMSLKQRCLRDLRLRTSTRSLQLIDVHGSGTIQRMPIHLVEQ